MLSRIVLAIMLRDGLLAVRDEASRMDVGDWIKGSQVRGSPSTILIPFVTP